MQVWCRVGRVWFLIAALLAVAWPAPVEAQVVWSEEFEGESIDRSIWSYDIGGHGWGNGQLEFNTDRRENSYIEDGKLVIEARREKYHGNEFTSARMVTRGHFAFQYGTLEARIKVPSTANGIWPAFWMLGHHFPRDPWPQCGEIDILEIGGKEGIEQGLQRRRINCALHFANAENVKESLVAWHNADVDLNDDYHIYKLVWTPARLEFFLDDVNFGGWDITAEYLAEYHQPFFLMLNVAVGSYKSSYNECDTPDKITASMPSRMYVDWIRLTRNDQTKLITNERDDQSPSASRKLDSSTAGRATGNVVGHENPLP
ncbi:MAG: glycoside hydrolase family 16 protein [Pirellulaceae bacterium]|nr:glycoside hydrolase family 16 protein [Planctomycetales bacterium]